MGGGVINAKGLQIMWWCFFYTMEFVILLHPVSKGVMPSKRNQPKTFGFDKNGTSLLNIIRDETKNTQIACNQNELVSLRRYMSMLSGRNV